MVEWLAVWGVGQATWSVFRPILEDLAQDVAKDAAKSYVGQCFKSVFSVIHREPLTKATGLALKELLELIESELIRADIEDAELREWLGDVRRFIKQREVREAIGSLFLQPDSPLDPKIFAMAWQQLDSAHTLPEGFSWQYIAKRFTAKVAEIRQSTTELQETLASLAKAQDSTALKELAGLPPDFNLETYREALVERYGTLDFASLDTTGAYYSGVRLWSVFVPQSVRECHEYDPQLLEVPKEHLQRLVDAGELDAAQLAESEKLQDERRRAYVNQPPRPVLGVTDDTAIQRLVVLGDPGSGKSSLLRFLALQWARLDDANLRYTQPLPLLIELREYNRWDCSSGKGFPKYLHEASTWHRLNQQTLKHLLAQPERVVLLLDGLDEVFDPGEREQVVNDIHRFSNDYKNVRILVTSRVVGYQPHRLRNAEFRHFMLQDLDTDQINNFLDRWHKVTFDKSQEAKPKRERLAKAIETSKSIGQLAGNPLLLTMMAILNRHQELPRDRVDLYQQCSRLLLHQWDVERALGEYPGLSAEIGLREKTDILRAIAYAMQTRVSDKSRANYIDGTTLTGLIEDYLHTELRFEQARAVARALVEQLRTRNFILCYLGADSYAFVHRTFLEYFCAANIVHQFNVAKTQDEPGLIELFDAHCREDDWHEVLRLICCQIDEQFVSHIVDHLATRTDLEEWDGNTPLPELPLAISCASEVRSKSRINFSETLVMSMISLSISAGGSGEILRFLLDDVVPACQELKGDWPGAEALGSIAISHIKNISKSSHGEALWPHLIAHIAEDREGVVSLTTVSHGSSGGRWYRMEAIKALSEKWPDENTRQLLTQWAVQNDYYDVRRTALQAIAEKWPDENTRQLLAQHAVQDESEYPRRTALQAIADKWPDENTRHLLAQRAVQDDHYEPRSTALQVLAAKWPDENTRHLLAQRAVQDDHYEPRRSALQAIAEKWPDENTRQLLAQRAVQDEDEDVRSTAFQAIAEKWPDENTRQLLAQRAIQDDNYDVRSNALQAIADKWPDENTRQLLAQWAVQNDNYDVRSNALRAIADKWPDENTRQLLTQRAVQDEDEQARCAACAALGKMHSEFGRILPTQDLDGIGPYLDPLEPIPRDHIEEAAKEAGIRDEDIDTQVAALSAHFGWDITMGTRTSRAEYDS